MSESAKQTAVRAKDKGPQTASAPLGSTAALEKVHATPAESARVPTGWRRVWLLCVLGFMLCTGLPWSCGASPVVWTVQWFAMPGISDKLLGIHAVLPLLALVVVASRETVPRVWPRMSVAMVSIASLFSLAIVCFSNLLPARPETATRVMAYALPRPITKFSFVLGYTVRAWVTIPIAILAGWALSTKGADRAPLATRLTVALWCFALTALWMPLGGQWGHFIALLAAGSTVMLAPWVEDSPSVLSGKQQLKLTLLCALWSIPLAVVSLVTRFGHSR